MSRTNWQVERRTKAALATPGGSTSHLSTVTRQPSTLSYQQRPESIRTGFDEEEGGVRIIQEENNASSDDDGLPGAYAVTRDDSSRDSEEEDWDPTTRDPSDNLGHDVMRDDSELSAVVHKAPSEQYLNEQKETWSMYMKRRWLCVSLSLALLVIIAVGAGVGVSMSSVKESTGTNETNISTETDTDDGSTMVIPDHNLFEQCERVGRIENITQSVRNQYNSIRSMNAFVGKIDTRNLDIHSCDAINFAFVWLAVDFAYSEIENDYYAADLFAMIGLISFYITFEGPGWTQQENWLIMSREISICNWYGVKCAPEGGILRLILPNNNLKGTLATNLELLDGLQRLDLSGNEIEGTIPTEIWSFPNLGKCDLLFKRYQDKWIFISHDTFVAEEVLLGGNNLNGTLPTVLGQDSKKLKRIHLSENTDLNGGLPSLAAMSNLIEISLGGTNLSGSLSALDFGPDLSSLEILDLSRMPSLTGVIPSSVSWLTSLKTLTLDELSLTGTIPKSIGNLTSLGKLRCMLRLCALQQQGYFSPTIMTENLIIQSTLVSGSIPTVLGSLSKLGT